MSSLEHDQAGPSCFWKVTLPLGRRATYPPVAKLKLVVLVLLLAVAVLGLLLWSEYIPHEWIVARNVVRSFAALLLTSGIISIFTSLLVRQELARFWLSAIGISDAVQESGVFAFGADFNSFDFRNPMRTSKSVDICVIHNESWFHSHKNDIADYLLHRDRTLRVCLLDEQIEDVGAALTRDFRYESGKLQRKIDTAFATLTSCVDDLQKDGQSTGHLQVWKHHRMPRHTYYRFDDDAFLVPYNLAVGSPKIPVIGCKVKESGLGEFLRSDFEALLKNHARLVYDSRAKQEGTLSGT